jgi:hypothetical protein
MDDETALSLLMTDWDDEADTPLIDDEAFLTELEDMERRIVAKSSEPKDWKKEGF